MKGLKKLSCILALAFATLPVITACETLTGKSPETTESVWDMNTVYAKAQELGYTGSLEEFIKTVTGKDGAKGEMGIGISTLYINAQGHLIVELTNSTEIDCGQIAVGATCSHNYQLYDSVNATCESLGYVQRVCAQCRDEKYEFIQPLGHDWELVEQNFADISIYSCKTCSLVKLGDAISGGGGEPIEMSKSILKVQLCNGAYSDSFYQLKAYFEDVYKDVSFEQGKQGVQVIVENTPRPFYDAEFQTGEKHVALYFNDTVIDPKSGAYADVTDLLMQDTGSGSILSRLPEEYLVDCSKDGEKYYSVPYIRDNWGILYNEDVFTMRGWKVPNTTDELLDLSREMCENNVIPLIAPGAYPMYWEKLLNIWWAQYDGMEDYENFYKGIDESGNTSVGIFDRKGKEEALAVLKSLMDGQALADMCYQVFVSHIDAQAEFLVSGVNSSRSTIAMLLDGAWANEEMAGIRTELQDVYPNALPTIRLMKTPIVSSIIDVCSSIETDAELSALITAIDNGATSFDGVNDTDFKRVAQARGVVSTLGYNIVISSGLNQVQTAIAKAFVAFITCDSALEETAKSCGFVTPYATISANAQARMDAIRVDNYNALRKGIALKQERNYPLYRAGLLPYQSNYGSRAFNLLREYDSASACAIAIKEYYSNGRFQQILNSSAN